VEIVPVDGGEPDDEEMEVGATTAAGKKAKKKKPAKKKAERITYRVASKRQLVVVLATGGLTHLVGGDTVMLHRTSNLHPVAVVLLRNSITIGLFGRQI